MAVVGDTDDKVLRQHSSVAVAARDQRASARDRWLG